MEKLPHYNFSWRVSLQIFGTPLASNGYFNTLPWQRLGNHVPVESARQTGSRGNRSVQNGRDRKPSIFRRLLISSNVSVDTNTNRTIEKLNGAVLHIRSAPKLYKEARLHHRERAAGSANRFPGQRLGSRGNG
jgi:hypothetical protein